MNKSESSCELCKWRGVHDKHCYYGYEQGELVKDNDHCSHFGGKEEQEKVDKKKSYFPKGFFSKERPLANGKEDETD